MIPSTPSRRLRGALALTALLVVAGSAGGCGRKIVAKVNGDPIHEDEFTTRLINFRGANPQSGMGAGLQMLSTLVNEAIVTQEAKRQNVAPTDDQVNKTIETISKQLAQGGQTFDQLLAQAGVTLESAKADIRSQLAQRNLVTKGLSVTDDEIKKFYDQNKANFGTPELFTIRQLTVADKKTADDARKELNGADFGLVAISRSIDIFKQQGGLVPRFPKSGLPPGGPIAPAVQQKAFTMKEGQISAPIQVGNQWVIVKLDKKEPAKTPTLEEMKDTIRDGLLQQKAQQSGQMDRVQQQLAQLRTQAEIEILNEQFKNAPQFQKQPTPSPGGTPGAPEGAAPPAGEGATPPAATPPGPNSGR